MGQDLWVEDEFRFAALNRGSDLFDAFAVEAHGRFDRDTGVVVGADNARMVLVDGDVWMLEAAARNVIGAFSAAKTGASR